MILLATFPPYSIVILAYWRVLWEEIRYIKEVLIACNKWNLHVQNMDVGIHCYSLCNTERSVIVKILDHQSHWQKRRCSDFNKSVTSIVRDLMISWDFCEKPRIYEAVFFPSPCHFWSDSLKADKMACAWGLSAWLPPCSKGCCWNLNYDYVLLWWCIRNKSVAFFHKRCLCDTDTYKQLGNPWVESCYLIYLARSKQIHSMPKSIFTRLW